MKRIANIVFYKFNGERPNMRQACIFYTDGTVKNVSYEEGLEACQEIVARYNITSKQAFKEMINNRAVYVMSGREFESRFQSFISREDLGLIPVEPQKNEMVPYQKVYNRKPNYTNNNFNNEEKAGLKNTYVPENFRREIEEEIDNKNKEFEKENNINEKQTANNFDNTNNYNTKLVENHYNETRNSNENKESKNNPTNNRPVVIPTPVKNNETKSNINVEPRNNDVKPKNNTALDEDFVNGLNENGVVIPPVELGNNNDKNNAPIEDEGLEDETENNNTRANEERTNARERVIVLPPVNPNNNTNNNNNSNPSRPAPKKIEEVELDDDEIIYDEDVDFDIEDEIEDEKAPEKDKKEKGFFAWIKRGIEKIKQSKLVKRITACVLALAVGLGLYSCAARQTKEGQMLNSNITTSTQGLPDDLNKRGGHLFLIHGNNNHYDDYSYEELLKVTKSEPQKTAMTNVATTLNGFNDTFANAHVEEGKNVKAALTFDEVVALQQAYNTYSNEEIRAIFNGATIHSGDMSRNYKDANLQLMGAYVISTRENPVDMSGLINSEEGKAFYRKYMNLFLDAKEATGEDKLRKIELFYTEVRRDFPVSNSTRTEGIAHADDYATIEPYKLAVTPIISAAEIMFQNYEVDYTLNDSEIDFLNDLGLCNYADDTFQRIETLTLTNPEDNKNPLYSQYRDSMIYMMIQEGNYYVDDEHRELTKLDAFQQQVNWHAFDGRWVYSSYTYTTTETHTETETWTETETTTHVEETQTELPITPEAQQEVDQQIEEENEQAEQQAQEEAQQVQQQMQQEADEEAQQIEEEVEQDAQDLQNNIDEANDQIQNNQDEDPTNDAPVNEDDLGHGTQFDDEHQDGNGNLNDSVENITTDPHGDETGMDFPDPNETGAEFDRAGEEMSSSSTEFEGDGFSTEETPKAAGVQKGDKVVRLSNEQIIDLYIEALANSQEYGYNPYQYRKI